jgi:hypothetical protein
VLHDKLTSEIDTVCCQFDAAHLKAFFNYDPQKPTIPCPKCFELKSSWSDRTWDFCQKQRTGKIECIACLSCFTIPEYLAALPGCYDEETCRTVAEKLKRAPKKGWSRHLSALQKVEVVQCSVPTYRKAALPERQ